MTFHEGLVVQYKDYVGTIQFICNSYITLCINKYPEERLKEVCILIYPEQFGKIKLLKESEK